MGRPPKVVVASSEETTEKVKDPVITLSAKFKVVDRDGTKTFPEYTYTGASIEECLEHINFPRGVNALVMVSVTCDGVKTERALAPHRARLILEYQNKIKSLEAIKASFRGVL